MKNTVVVLLSHLTDCKAGDIVERRKGFVTLLKVVCVSEFSLKKSLESDDTTFSPVIRLRNRLQLIALL